MARIYSNYGESELEGVKKRAEELGFSVSSFQKYCVMLALGDRNTKSLANIKEEMLRGLEGIEIGDTFIVSALFHDKWPVFSRSVKMQIAKSLAAYIKRNPEKFIVIKKVKGTINMYQKVR